MTDFRPMLAHTYTERRARFPASVQPKLDGVRCVAIDGRLWSRNGKPFHVPHIEAALWPGHPILDGELYCHGMPFGEIVSRVRRNQPGSLALQFHVYDLPSGEVWLTRRMRLVLAARDHFRHEHVLCRVRDVEVSDAAELAAAERDRLAQGYEGVVLRTFDGLYRPGARSADVLKLKRWLDGEATVVGLAPGRGKFEGVSILRCQTDAGVAFDCTPPGDLPAKRSVGPQHIGRRVTVRYFELTPDGAPRFPVAIAFRDYE